MGIFQQLGLAPRLDLLQQQAVASPWTDGQLQSIIWSDILGEGVSKPVSRADAMRVPAIARARNLICLPPARLPLKVLDANGPLPDDEQPTWTYTTAGSVSPFQRMVWTLDDLLFHGHALWSAQRGSEGQLLAVERLPREWWSINEAGAILVRDKPVKARDVIYFASHTDPLLEAGKSTIEAAHATQKAVAKRAANPVPVTELHHTDSDTPVSSDEAKEYVKGYNAARRDPDGATVFTPSHIDLRTHGDKADSGALVEARNASRLDIANHTGVPASLLEGTSAGASLTYVTTEGKRSEFLEFGLQPWLDTIQWRLSMDDVVPRGKRVRFDLSETLAIQPSATGAEVQD